MAKCDHSDMEARLREVAKNSIWLGGHITCIICNHILYLRDLEPKAEVARDYMVRYSFVRHTQRAHGRLTGVVDGGSPIDYDAEDFPKAWAFLVLWSHLLMYPIYALKAVWRSVR